MANLDIVEFSKKYSFAIDGIKKRIKDDTKRQSLVENLYKDAMANNIKMEDVDSAIKLFYQGNVLGQVKMNNYIDRYK